MHLVEELRLLEEAGLERAEVLRCATRGAAESLGKLHEFGTVDVGKRADLVLVRDNPLDNLDHLEKIEGVLVHGRWLDRAKLDAGLAAIATKHAR